MGCVLCSPRKPRTAEVQSDITRNGPIHTPLSDRILQIRELHDRQTKERHASAMIDIPLDNDDDPPPQEVSCTQRAPLNDHPSESSNNLPPPANEHHQLNTQPLHDAELQLRLEQTAKDAVVNFYLDGETLESFVDIRVPVMPANAVCTTASELCVPLTVLNYDETLRSVHVRLLEEVKDQLDPLTLARCEKRRFVLCGDREIDVLGSGNEGGWSAAARTNSSASQITECAMWREYIAFNQKNLAGRPRPVFGDKELGPDSDPIDTTPVVIRWVEM